MPLTNLIIDSAKPKATSYRISDAHGLCLFIAPTGAKVWRYRYRFAGREQTMSLGTYPRVTLKEARDLHSAARKTLDSGINPMAERKAVVVAKQEVVVAKQAAVVEAQRAAADSFEQIARKWWEWWAVGKSPRHTGQVMRRIEADIFPAYGHKAMADITPADVQQLMLKIEQRGAQYVAKRAHETTSQVYRFAIVRGLAARNPAADFQPRDVLAAVPTQNQARVDVKDLPELLRKIEDYNGDAVTILALKLMAYTFVRTSELIEAPWSEFDLDRARWTIPAERMKMPTPHIVPLSTQAVEVLRTLRGISGHRDLVFPGAVDKRRPMSNNTILYALYRMGYKGVMTGHGFRGVASTVLHEHEFAVEHIELQLAHQQRNAVAAAYNHAKYYRQRAVMMQWWADYLAGQLAKGRIT